MEIASTRLLRHLLQQSHATVDVIFLIMIVSLGSSRSPQILINQIGLFYLPGEILSLLGGVCCHFPPFPKRVLHRVHRISPKSKIDQSIKQRN